MDKEDVKVSLISKNDSEQEKVKKADLIKLLINTKLASPELRITGKDYKEIGIHDEWRSSDSNDDTTYFSYQETAVKEFIYSFNRCGILSDQVGMGKTIEAGMIISELAYNKELNSLLILVPNDIMANKWENELAKKFGFRNIFKDQYSIIGDQTKSIKYTDFPKIFCVKTIDDFYSLIANVKYKEINESIIAAAESSYSSIVSKAFLNDAKEKITEKLKTTNSRTKAFLNFVMDEMYSEVISSLVKNVAKKLGYEDKLLNSNYAFDSEVGNYYLSLNAALDQNSIVNDPDKLVNVIFDKDNLTRILPYEFTFVKKDFGEKYLKDLERRTRNAKEAERIKIVDETKKLARDIREEYRILIVANMMNKNDSLLSKEINEYYISNSSSFFSVGDSTRDIGYRVIDMLKDMCYETLIVDEAHDYINVSHKIPMKESVSTQDFFTTINGSREPNLERLENEFKVDHSEVKNQAKDYHIFPLFSDYFFVPKKCLFVGLKELADRSHRKIFMTATPIKSEMADFYLLKMLADNTASKYNDIRYILNEEDFDCIANLISLATENLEFIRYEVNYLSKEDVVLKYLYEYYSKNKDKLNSYDDFRELENSQEPFVEKIKYIIRKTKDENEIDLDVLRSSCINQTRFDFQHTFTIYEKDENGNNKVDLSGKPIIRQITTINELVNEPNGVKLWKNMYSQIGIRKTRHQTYKLDETRRALLCDTYAKKYSNLPYWSKRQGVTIFIHKEDNYFDLIVKDMIDSKENQTQNIDSVIENKSIKSLEEREKDIRERYNSMMEKEFAVIDNDYSYTDDKKEEEKDNIRRKYEKETDIDIKKINSESKAYEIYNYINDSLSSDPITLDYWGQGIKDYKEFKISMIMALMTKGLKGQLGDNDEEKIVKIGGKILLFVDPEDSEYVYKRLKDELNNKNYNLKACEDLGYIPLYKYNQECQTKEDRWTVENEIRKLNDSSNSNCIIVIGSEKFEEGIDLQKADSLINFNIKFCPLKMEQRIGRIDRVKLSSSQPSINIYSFAALNDMSGFMVDFLANKLRMFSSWKGDTTGIVSLPIGSEPNSSSFEKAIEYINNCYEDLYNNENPDSISSFNSHYGELSSFLKSIANKFDNEIDIKQFTFDEIKNDFTFLGISSQYLNKIAANTKVNNKENADSGNYTFGESREYSQNKQGHPIDKLPNNLRILKDSATNFYTNLIDYYNDELKKEENTGSDSGVRIGSSLSFSDLKNNYQRDMANRLKENYEKFCSTEFIKLDDNTQSIKKEVLDKAINPIRNLYKDTVLKYLDVLRKLFVFFSDTVRQKSNAMSKFTTYLAIEEFKGMTKNE